MDEKDYVSFKTALALKETGFDRPCQYYYTKEDAPDGHVWCMTSEDAPIDYNKTIYAKCSMPALWQAQKWLRETKNLHISIIRNACGYGYDICKADNGTHITDGIFDGPNDGGQWDTYEEALEAGIQEALELI